MLINFSPLRSDEKLELSRSGDAITINGELFDFTQLADGETLPADAIASNYFAGPVERIDGALSMTLRLPHGASPSQAVAFPEPLVVTEDGPVEIPT